MSTTNKLETYKRKRNFGKTPEPAGKVLKQKSLQPAFVVQKHKATTLHYDFRLEIDGVLKSWAVPKGPSEDPSEKRLAVPTEDHPLSYKDFEGTIPEGQYGAGTVAIWDQGTYQNIREVSMIQAYHEGKIEIDLHGKKLKGNYVLVKMQHSFQKDKEKPWLLIKRRDV